MLILIGHGTIIKSYSEKLVNFKYFIYILKSSLHLNITLYAVIIGEGVEKSCHCLNASVILIYLLINLDVLLKYYSSGIFTNRFSVDNYILRLQTLLSLLFECWILKHKRETTTYLYIYNHCVF